MSVDAVRRLVRTSILVVTRGGFVMARPEDVALLIELEAQLRELTYLLGRIETVGSTLLPPSAHFWRGAAGRAYEAKRLDLAAAVSEGLAAVDGARSSTALAVQQVMNRV
jgi:hypothetical protein